MRKTIRAGRVAGLLLVPVLAGCAAAAGAAAGAAAAIAYTDRGAEATISASVDEIADATEVVFDDMNIELTEREIDEDGSEIEIEGERGETDVVVDIDREDSRRTHVQVTAREDVVQYDRDYARDILRRIIDRVR